MKDIDEFETSLESSLDELSQESISLVIVGIIGLITAAVMVGDSIKSSKSKDFYKNNKEAIDNFTTKSQESFVKELDVVRKILTPAKLKSIIGSAYKENKYISKEEFINTFKITLHEDYTTNKLADDLQDMKKSKSIHYQHDIYTVASSGIISGDDDGKGFDLYYNTLIDINKSIKKLISDKTSLKFDDEYTADTMTGYGMLYHNASLSELGDLK